MSLRIDKMFAFISTDENGDEGVCGMTLPDGRWLPLVGADMERVESLRKYGKELAKISGRDIKVVEFSKRDLVEVISP